MKNKFKWGGLIALISFLGLAGAASATPITFDFQTGGSAAITDWCGLNCGTLHTDGALFVEGVLAGGFKGTMVINGDVEDTSTWSFFDFSGNSIFGTLSGDLQGLLGLIGTGTLDYLITGGTGFFAGATGWGDSEYGFLLGGYGEHGTMNVELAAVPEPAISTLLLAGFGMVAFLAYRRRRASTQI
jgi:hypothetical protein